MRTHWKLALVAALAAALLATSGCMIRREALPASDEGGSATESVSLGTATSANVRIAMGAGEISIDGSDLGTDVLQGTFEYTPSTLKPEVDRDTDGDVVEVSVSHPDIGGINLGGAIKSAWELQLAEGVPMDLGIRMGAGESDLDLAGLDISDLTVEMGAGDAKVDLSGPRPRDLFGQITAGAGEVTIRLPEDVGVRVFGRKDGIGEWNYEGFTTDGDYLVNDAYGTSATTIELDVQRGVGTVTLELVD